MSSFYLLLVTFLLTLLLSDAAHDYKDALQKSITFFHGQRSGKLPPPDANGPEINWRGDSALADGRQAGVDLTGGYYDAGDNEKFNFPMAFTTTMLSWSTIEFGKSMGADQVKRAREAIRWSTDYLLKSASKVKSSGVLYVGVGNGDSDHSCWERPEDIDGDPQGGGAYREVYSVSASNRGADIAAETAAALAAASIVFRNADRAYSRKLLATAKDVLQFAETYRGGNSNHYYPSYSGDTDDMFWGSAWLLRATRNENKYLNYIRSLGANDEVDLFSWDNKYAGANVLLSRRFLLKNSSDPSSQEYSKKAETFICKILSPSHSTSSNTHYTPGGLLYKNVGGSNLQYVTSITFLMTTYAKYMSSTNRAFSCGSSPITSKILRGLAKTQVDYILGDNPKGMSYMVGYGKKYPQRIHHRGSSIPSIRAHPQAFGCHGGDSYLSTQDPNPNILIGAIVGGPGGDDGYEDQRGNYAQSEPATYINAPFVGTLAYIVGIQK